MNKQTGEGINRGFVSDKTTVCFAASMIWQAFTYLRIFLRHASLCSPVLLPLQFIFKAAEECYQLRDGARLARVGLLQQQQPLRGGVPTPQQQQLRHKDHHPGQLQQRQPPHHHHPPSQNPKQRGPERVRATDARWRSPALPSGSSLFFAVQSVEVVASQFKQAALSFLQMQWTIRIQRTSSSPPMEWCRAIITYPGAWLEAGPTDSSPQGHTPSSSSSPSISARYLQRDVLFSKRLFLRFKGIVFCNDIGQRLSANFKDEN